MYSQFTMIYSDIINKVQLGEQLERSCVDGTSHSVGE